MPADVFYGADCEVRLGVMPDKDSDPSAWQKVEFVSGTFQKQRDRKERPLIGAPRQNALDPIKPIDGFESLTADIVVDADTRQLPLWLVALLGAPISSTPSDDLMSHEWNSGNKVPRYACLQIKVGDEDIRIYRGLTLDTVALQSGGDQVQDYDIQLSLVGISSARAADFLSGSVVDVPGSAPITRFMFRADGSPASNALSASWSYSRGLNPEKFLSPLAKISGLRPGSSGLSGQVQFRAVGADFDGFEEDGTEFTAELLGLGSVADHYVALIHPQVKLNAPPLVISGPGVIERTFTWFGYQSPSTPGAVIVVTNDAEGYN